MNMAIELEEGKGLADYLKVFKRRKKFLLIPAGVVFAIALLAAVLWPPTYQSRATILIEQQQIPKDLVTSTVTSFAAQQIEVIKARIMTMKNIMSLVSQYGLYDEDELRTKASSEIVGEFVEDVGVDVISAGLIDPKTGRPTEATIAFNVSYQHSNPQKAMKVTNDLVNLFLNENLRDRTEKSASTTSFLKEEVDALSKELEQQEQTLAEFKQENEGSLPELYQYNLQVMERTEREMLDVALRIKELKKRKLELESKLVQISPYAPTVMPDGQQVLSDYDRLKSLKSSYRQKIAVYSPEHPDVQRLKREIEVLQNELGVTLTPEEYATQLRGEKNLLAELRQKYTADHPKVVAQERVVAQMEKEKPTLPASESIAEERADNPAYVLLQSQLKSTEVEIQILQENKKELDRKLKEFEDHVLKAPTVEKQYLALQRNYNNAAAKYTEMKSKQMAAELGRSLEQERKGERFTLIEPATMPEEPVSPNRPAIIFLGFVLAVGVGVACAIIVEAMSPAVRGREMLMAVSGIQTLAVVPYIETDLETAKDDGKKLQWVAVGVVVLILGIIAIHFFYKPLDVLWFVLLRKFGLG